MLYEFARLRDIHIRGVLAMAAASAVFGAGGCSSSSTAPASPADAAAVCPAAPQDTIGKACAVEGTVCGPQYACGSTLASLYCVCAGGTFQCRDGTGALNPGDMPACPGAPAQPPSCPASLAAADRHPCGTAGQICAYPSACPHALDQCTCFPGETATGGFGIVYVCQPAACGSDASSPPPPPADAAPNQDAAPPGDAAPDDATSDANPYD